MSRDVDCVIIGGGLVGATMAVALARAGRAVALVEAQKRPAPEPASGSGDGASASTRLSHDDRTLVINAASLNILGNLGLLPDSSVRCPIDTIDVTRQGGFGRLSLNASDHGRSCFGQVIVARELGRIALASLRQNEQITEYCPDRLKDWTADADGVSIRLDSGAELRAGLLIGADGNDSSVRAQAGLACHRHEYGQSAMIFNVVPERPTPATAHERFTPQGPLALLPQPQGRMGVVWIDTDAAIDAAMGLDDAALCDRLRQRFGSGMGHFGQPGKRARYPLIRQRTPHPVGERVAVIGNAANAVHPVSAQGFNLGLRDVAGLVDATAGVDDLGDPSSLAAYAAARRDDQGATVRYTDTLARAFTNPSSLAQFGAGLGIIAHAGLPGLRHRLVHAAMGFRAPLPSLARPPATEDSKTP
jgi:2-octaprenyl-6-methoxyphenol hydroxylase